MNFRKLLTYLSLGTAAVIPFAGAQNPTILQGNYVSNVFGQANFVLNPNAQTNVANVTNATRSTTTPLVATSEFNLNLTSGTFATWTLRAFDSGMKGQNCEARFSYRGFATATSTAEIVQNSLVVAQLVLTPSTDPRIASINFPCGDLANATTFRIAQTTASMTGTNEIGGIYTGLATNQANVAQAEALFTARGNAGQTLSPFVSATIIFNSVTLDSQNGYNVATGIYTVKKPGRYIIFARVGFTFDNWDAGSNNKLWVRKNGVISGTTNWSTITESRALSPQITHTVDVNAGDTLNISMYQDTSSNKTVATITDFSEFSISRFPTSSELVVTPERQNTFAGITSDLTSGTGGTTSTTFVQVSGLGNYTSLGKATSPGSMQFTVPTIPPGSYKLDFQMLAEATPSATGDRTDCIFSVYDGSTDRTAAYITSKQEVTSAGTPVQGGVIGSVVIQYTSVQSNKQFSVRARRNNGAGTCNWYGQSLYASFFTITPLDQPSNSALYVQGPVLSGQTGSVLPVGYIGEIITSASSATGSFANGVVTQNVGTLTLTPGTWLVSANIQFIVSGSFTFNALSISTSSGSFDTSSGTQPQPATAGAFDSYGSLTRVLRVTSSTPVYAVTKTWIPTGTSTYGNMAFSAVRIGSN